MSHQRGDIVEIIFELPYNESSKPHPVIILSNDDVYQQDGLYICVMITHMKSKDQYTFEIEDKMLLKGGNGVFSQARCHLLTNVSDEDIISNGSRNSMKIDSLERLVTRIEQVTLR